MKVLHIISGGDTGGAKTHVLTVLNELQKDIEVSLLCVMNGKFTEEAKDLGIKTTIFEQSHRFSFGTIKQMKKHIFENDFDLIHCHGARANYIATMLKIIGVKKPFLTTIHSDYLLDFSDNIYKKIIFTNINIFALKRFQNFCAITENFKDMLLTRGFENKNIFTIYNGINIIEKPFVSKNEFFDRYNIPKDSFYVGLCARLNSVKGIETFLKMANELKNEQITFLLAGTGEEKEKYEAYKVENNLDNVHFLGHIDDINSFYNVLDINTLTSLSESFPYALLEGGLMKKPTISASVGGIPEMIVDQESGLLFAREDYKSLSNHVLKLRDNEELRNRFGENFYNRILDNFSSVKMKERHIEIYNEILNNRR